MGVLDSLNSCEFSDIAMSYSRGRSFALREIVAATAVRRREHDLPPTVRFVDRPGRELQAFDAPQVGPARSASGHPAFLLGGRERGNGTSVRTDPRGDVSLIEDGEDSGGGDIQQTAGDQFVTGGGIALFELEQVRPQPAGVFEKPALGEEKPGGELIRELLPQAGRGAVVEGVEALDDPPCVDLAEFVGGGPLKSLAARFGAKEDRGASGERFETSSRGLGGIDGDLNSQSAQRCDGVDRGREEFEFVQQVIDDAVDRVLPRLAFVHRVEILSGAVSRLIHKYTYRICEHISTLFSGVRGGRLSRLLTLWRGGSFASPRRPGGRPVRNLLADACGD
jgi:hypothetical protein